MRRARCVVGAVLVGIVATACAGDDAMGSRTSRPQSRSTSPSASVTDMVCYEARREADTHPIELTDATRELALTDALAGWYGHATAVGDVNGDGWTDLFFGGFADKTRDAQGNRAPDRILLGGPRGFAIDDSFKVEPGRTSGAAFADLDGDGDLDLVLARNYRDQPGGSAPSVVLRNDGGHLTQASVLDARRGGRSIGVLDYDGDGRLDIFLVEDRFSGGSSALFRNEGAFRFSDATAAAGLPSGLAGLGVAVADLTADRRPDLFVSDSNRLFVNAGDGSFREAHTSVFDWPRIGNEDDVAGVAVGDLNRDGRPDLVLGQHFNSTLDRGALVSVRLYLNDATAADGTPQFRDVTKEAGLTPLPTKAPHVEIVDLDGDGWPDILTTASVADGTQPAIFRNLGVENGAPRFQAPPGIGSKVYWIAGATFDVDHDGDLDVFVVQWEPQRVSSLLRNDGAGGHWLGVQVGPSGTAGVGASVEVFRAGGLGDPSELLGAREITVSTGFGSGSLPLASFGLGREATIDVRVSYARAEGAGPEVLRRLPADRLVQVGGDGSCGA